MRKYVSKKPGKKFESTTRMGQLQNEKKELWVVPRRSYPGQSRRNSFGGAIFRMPKFRSPTGPPRMFYCVPVMQNNKFLAQSLSELSPLSRLASQKIWKFQTPHRDEKSRSMEIHRKKKQKKTWPHLQCVIFTFFNNQANASSFRCTISTSAFNLSS